ncbi:hypothetical protein [Burkholderia stagnalis]|uniref:hypothetical protein n=1 Tax=Burkholderia stagnalis TaxID=1503054 RepID=UPI000F56490C|nr:hypothetical protein [Burkholderia stagnalis]RQR11291.1 hypothetical protein DF025_17125 [Burkholderia stagnalis]RQR20319.1 hypothetical protein DF026_16930 [Burkholderia stagnalis]
MYADTEIFSFSGHVVGDGAASIKSGFVLAASAQAAIDGMREAGFNIQAISSLAEVKQTIGILDLIAEQNPEVDASEYVDVYPGDQKPYPADNVFCFTGHLVDAAGALKAGFIVASSVDFVVEYLRGFGFLVQSAQSLSDLRRLGDDLTRIAAGGEDSDDEGLLNFMN